MASFYGSGLVMSTKGVRAHRVSDGIEASALPPIPSLTQWAPIWFVELAGVAAAADLLVALPAVGGLLAGGAFAAVDLLWVHRSSPEAFSDWAFRLVRKNCFKIAPVSSASTPETSSTRWFR